MICNICEKESVCKLKDGSDVVKCAEFMGIKETDYKMTSDDCISRQAVNTLIDELARAISDERCCISRGRDTATIMQEILDLPSIQPETGYWIEEPNCWTRCSCCGEHYPQTSIYGFIGSNYCPNCGTKMVESQESEDKE